jgi:antitoxin ParD1/3/4
VSLMSLQLTRDVEELIHDKLKSGRYGSESEIVREALGLLEERDEMLLFRKDEIRRQIAEGVASLRAGQGVDGEAVFDRIEAELDALERDDHG